MQYIGDKNTPFTSLLTATAFYPELKLADFQQQYGFLEDQTEYAVNQTALIIRSIVHRQLKTLIELHPNLIDVSQSLFGDDVTAAVHYQAAVFANVAADLINTKMATDATKEAADRQEALTEKVNQLNTQARRSIDQLLQLNSGYKIELI